MFQSTGWILEEQRYNHLGDKYNLEALTFVKPPKNQIFRDKQKEISEIGIIQQYQFSSTLQRMSVIIQISGSKEFKSYTKGSPEMILTLSKPETVPAGINVTLQKYTERGFRVIALASSKINVKTTQVFFDIYKKKFI